MNNNLPSKTIFYSIEKTIKAYRKYAQHNLSKKSEDLTVNQSLVLQFLHKNNSLSQGDLAKLLFKENASITRMVESMVKKKYLIRKMDTVDRRKSIIKIAAKGMSIMDELDNIILSNRKKALAGISENELTQLKNTLDKITKNCISS